MGRVEPAVAGRAVRREVGFFPESLGREEVVADDDAVVMVCCCTDVASCNDVGNN